MRDLDYVTRLLSAIREALMQEDTLDLGLVRQTAEVLVTVSNIRDAQAAGIDVPDSVIDHLLGLNTTE